MKNRLNLIFVVEANNISQSDYMYIKRIIGEYYTIGFNQLYAIYAGSKSNLIKQDKRIEKMIKDLPGQSHIIIVADVDSPTNIAYSLNEPIEKYCKDKKYDIVWMNLTVEDVVLGETIVSREKAKKAIAFSRKNKLCINIDSLKCINPKNRRKSTNLFLIIDKYLKRIDKDN